jgi:hypothetical protein
MNLDLAIALRDFIATWPDLPVPQSALLIDSLNEERCLTIQLMDGVLLATDIDGYRRVSQPFVLLFKDKFSDSATKRAAILEALNKAGKWFITKSNAGQLPEFDNMRWEKIDQVNYAGLLLQDNASMTYTAQYALIYSYFQQ